MSEPDAPLLPLAPLPADVDDEQLLARTDVELVLDDARRPDPGAQDVLHARQVRRLADARDRGEEAGVRRVRRQHVEPEEGDKKRGGRDALVGAVVELEPPALRDDPADRLVLDEGR